MANRLSKIVTRTGDDGTTGLASGDRVAKHRTRVAAMGDVDELNSSLGLLLSEPIAHDLRGSLLDIQHDLFDLGGELSLPGHTLISLAHLERLDGLIAQFNSELPPLRDFILPGGSRPAALAHMARTICRRAERTVVALSSEEPIAPLTGQYLNRLSDLLFVIARLLNRDTDHGDVLWQQGRNGT
jgi:cob(I)alamin adenosyltransferase